MKNKFILPGLVLILAGGYFLVGALPGVSLPFGAFMMLIGALLLLCRLFSHGKFGLTIAGMVVFWMGTGNLMMDLLDISWRYAMVSTPLSLSLAFFLIHICEYRRLGNWPMVPALLLMAFAAFFFLLLTPSVNAVLKPYYGTILPIALIIVGICLLIRGNRRSKKPLDEPQPAEEEPIPAPELWAQPPMEAETAVQEEAAPEPVTAQPEPLEDAPVPAADVPADAAAEPAVCESPAQEPAPAAEAEETKPVQPA